MECVMLKCSWPRRASQVYLYFSAVTPPTILVTGPFSPHVFSPGTLLEAEHDCRISPFLLLRRNTRLTEVRGQRSEVRGHLKSTETSVWVRRSEGQQVTVHFRPEHQHFSQLALPGPAGAFLGSYCRHHWS